MATPRSIAFHTLGCKLNFSETSAIGRQFEAQGYLELPFDQVADIYVINTCSVTDFADRKCRNAVRSAMKRSPQALIVVTGCYAQLKPTEIAEIPGVDLVLGAAEKFRMLDYVEGLSKAQGKGMVAAGEIKELNTFSEAFSFGDRTRTFLKVQDGCDYKCSFCTIPLARGKSRSDNVDNVLANAQKIVDLGSKEIVLTGVNLGDFGNGTEVLEGLKPKKEALFSDLLEALDSKIEIPRFRISSIEPNLLSSEIIQFVANSRRIMPHFHIPLQSGNNKQLQQMRRRYKRELYTDRVEEIKRLMPNACIGVDVIVGFPGETAEDFEETFRFIHDLDISYLHVFTYSERPNTLAATMDETVPMQIRKMRNERLRALSLKKMTHFYLQFEGQVRPVLFEKDSKPGMMSGFTDNYIKVRLPLQEDLINTVADILIGPFDGDHAISQLANEKY